MRCPPYLLELAAKFVATPDPEAEGGEQDCDQQRLLRLLQIVACLCQVQTASLYRRVYIRHAVTNAPWKWIRHPTIRCTAGLAAQENKAFNPAHEAVQCTGCNAKNAIWRAPHRANGVV